MSDPATIATIAAIAASVGGIAALLKELFKTILNELYIKIKGKKPNVEISITGNDGSVQSIKFKGFDSKSLSESEIKKIVNILKEVNDADTKAS